MNTAYSRRQFLKRSTLAAGALALAPAGLLPAQAVAKRTAVDQVTLGHTGLKLSRLGMGTGSSSYGGTGTNPGTTNMNPSGSTVGPNSSPSGSTLTPNSSGSGTNR